MTKKFNRGLLKFCQVCGSKDLNLFINLGYHPAVNDFYSSEILSEVVETYPMPILSCNNCDLVQLGIQVEPTKVFPSNYAYRSGTTKILIDNFKDLLVKTNKIKKLSNKTFIVDIGSDDGTLLKNFFDFGCKVLGVEPTDVCKIATQQGIDTVNKPFSIEVARKIKKLHDQADLITAANVFAHIEKPNDIVDGIYHLLKDDGIFISENHYLFDLIDTLQYDTFYHEHLRYYSLMSLTKLFDLHNMRIFHVEKIPTHGGSIRVFTCKKHAGYIETEDFKKIINNEYSGQTLRENLDLFSSNVRRSKIEILNKLTHLRLKNKKIIGISAPSRASTLINYLGIDSSIIDYICEIQGSLKIGKNIPGTDINVVDESRLFTDNPDYAFIFSWHIADGLMNILRAKGFKGKFIIPLPELKIID